MATGSQNGSSILTSVARHEKELLAKLEATDEECQKIIDDARAEARQFRENDTAVLNTQIAQKRREAEAERNAAYQAVVEASEAKLAALREEARSKQKEVAREVMQLILPKRGAS